MLSIVLAAGKQLDRNSNSGTRLYVDRFRKNGQVKMVRSRKQEKGNKDKETEHHTEKSARELGKTFRKSTLKVTAVIAGIAVFWIVIAKRRKK